MKNYQSFNAWNNVWAEYYLENYLFAAKGRTSVCTDANEENYVQRQ